MSDLIQYAFRIDAQTETPCHLSDLKKSDVFYMVDGVHKSDLLIATDDAFSSVVNETTVWSVPSEKYE